MLHHWPKPVGIDTALDRIPHVVIPTGHDLHSLVRVKGYNILGTFAVPPPTGACGFKDAAAIENGINEFLTSLVDNVGPGISPVNNAISRLARAPFDPPSRGRGLPVQIFAVPVHTNAADAIFPRPGREILWNWVDEEDPLPMMGHCWQLDVDDAIADARLWVGGRFRLLARSVPVDLGDSDTRWR